MNSQLTTYITLVCTSGTLNLFLCVFVFFKRHDYGKFTHFFILNAAAVTIYCFSYAFGLTSTTLEQIKFWNVIQYIGMPFAPPLGLLFVTQYLGYRITRTRIAALLVIPLISFLMVATNDLHHLHYKTFEIVESRGAPYSYIELGIWYVVHGAFLFGCMFAGFLLLLSRWRETTKSYRPQIISLMCGQLIPMVTAFLYLVGVWPEGIDPVPMVIWISSILYLWAIISMHMLTIIPIAKETIFHSMNDGVIVLDESNRLIEFNQACKGMFGKLDKSMFGEHLDQVWFVLFGKAFPFNPESASDTQELKLYADGLEYIYQVRISPLQYSHNSGAGILIIFTDITELKRLQLKLEDLAYYDELTEIYNRRAFFEYCEKYYAAAKKDCSPFTIILSDIDYFKRVNDTYGHQVGDRLLVHFVQICHTQLSEEILFARYGGEEFVLVLNGRSVSEGQALVEQIREYLETQPFVIDESVITVTASFGVAEATGHAEETLDQLLYKADSALYAAKRGGRNQVRVF